MAMTRFLMARRTEPDQGRALADVLAGHAIRDRGGVPAVADPDTDAANLLARGYMPG
jgi:hypothetical protein